MIQLLKEFIYAGDRKENYSFNKNFLFGLLGFAGALISLSNTFHFSTHVFYFLGPFLLLLTALHFKLSYFTIFELVLIADYAACLLSMGRIFQLALPTLLFIQILVFYFLSGQLKNAYVIIGLGGIALLSVGFAFPNYWVFFVGNTAIAIYSFFNAYAYHRISLIWGILHTLFALIALFKIYLFLINYLNLESLWIKYFL